MYRDGQCVTCARPPHERAIIAHRLAIYELRAALRQPLFEPPVVDPALDVRGEPVQLRLRLLG